jgi:hypothetical protein
MNCTPLRQNLGCRVEAPSCSGRDELAVVKDCHVGRDGGEEEMPDSGSYCYAVSRECQEDHDCVRRFFTARDGAGCGVCAGYVWLGRCVPP